MRLLLWNYSVSFCPSKSLCRTFFLLLFMFTLFCCGHAELGSAHLAVMPATEAVTFDDFTGKRLPVVRITLDEKGFSPNEISRSQGPFILAIHNRTKVEELALNLSKVAGNKLHDMNFRRQRQDWRKLITLSSGTYALSVPSRPSWKCNIVIK